MTLSNLLRTFVALRSSEFVASAASSQQQHPLAVATTVRRKRNTSEQHPFKRKQQKCVAIDAVNEWTDEQMHGRTEISHFTLFGARHIMQRNSGMRRQQSIG